MLAFSTITVTMVPALMAQHQEAVEHETLAARVDGESKRSEMRRNSVMDRILASGQRTIRKTEAHMNKNNRSEVLQKVS